jgi:phosphoribosylanthranilate isomerase
MPTRVKICGITRLEDARLATELGAAALGFNFFRPSPRYLEPSRARQIIAQLPRRVATVGIFAEVATSEEVERIARDAGVSVVQLHQPGFALPAAELADFNVALGVPVKPGFEPATLASIGADAILLDASDPQLHGGTGKAFDWTLAREAGRYATIILAGGLTASNVEQAICHGRPFAVDVASGVESAPGIKDPAKLRAFFKAVEIADSKR